MYCLLNLMSVSGVSLTCVVSVLGYCLLPIVALSGVSVLFSLAGLLGNILTGAAVCWCAVSSSKVRTRAGAGCGRNRPIVLQRSHITRRNYYWDILSNYTLTLHSRRLPTNDYRDFIFTHVTYDGSVPAWSPLQP